MSESACCKGLDLKVEDLPVAEIRSRFEGSGLRLRTGPVVVAIHSEIEALQFGVARLYNSYEVAGADEFVDFEVSVERPFGLRRWIRPQALFKLDSLLPFEPLPLSQAYPMLEWGLNWCVSSHYHGTLTVHSAVVERGGGALLLPAPPGSGKSTLCAAMIHSGWRLLSDELVLIDPGNGEIIPLPRPVSLKNSSIGIIQSFAPEAVLSSPVHDTSKGVVAHLRPPVESVQRMSERAVPRWIVFPRFEMNAVTGMLPLSKPQALVKLIDNSFNFQVHGLCGFDALADVVERSECFTLVFGELSEGVALLAQLIPADGSAARSRLHASHRHLSAP